MHAADPVQRSRLLRHWVKRDDGAPVGAVFHHELAEIFTSNRDPHVTHARSEPYCLMTAYLPFLFQARNENDRPTYLLPQLVPGFEHLTFRNGMRRQPTRASTGRGGHQRLDASNLRAGPLAGRPWEDLGVPPYGIRRMTRRDVSEGNADLLEHVGRILSWTRAFRLAMRDGGADVGSAAAHASHERASCLDLHMNGQPAGLLPMGNGANACSNPGPGRAAGAGSAAMTRRVDTRPHVRSDSARSRLAASEPSRGFGV